jgi:hypothetical protein
VVQAERQVAVGADGGRNVGGDDLLVGHGEHEVGIAAVLELEQLLDAVTATALPQLRRIDDRHEHLLGPDRVQLLANDLLDRPVHAPAGRQPRPQAAADLAGEAGADRQLVGERLGVGGRLLLGRQEVVGEACHGVESLVCRGLWTG